MARLPPKEREDALAATRRAAAATNVAPGRSFFGGFFDSPEIYFGLGLNSEPGSSWRRAAIMAARAGRGALPARALTARCPYRWTRWCRRVCRPCRRILFVAPGQPIVYRSDPDGYVIYSSRRESPR